VAKADETRAKIIRQAADLFNQQGFAGVSMSDIMQATGLKKGGIYNHFSSKDELALAAFDYAASQVGQRYLQALKTERTAVDRLKAMITTFSTAPDKLALQGGCPLMNTAIDSDDAHPVLREKARQAMERWRSLLHRTVRQGIQRGELPPQVDADEVSTIIIATLEGALMLMRLYDEPTHLQRAKHHLDHYVESLQINPAQPE